MRCLAELLYTVYNSISEREFSMSARYPIETFLVGLNDSLNKILVMFKKRKWLSANDTRDLVADQALYAYPTDCLDRIVHTVDLIDAQGVRRNLEFNTTDVLDTQYQGWRTAASSLPQFWYPDSENGQIGLYPKPSDTVTDGLIVSYARRHPRVWRLSGTMVNPYAKATVTYGSTAVQCSATWLLLGDYFGAFGARFDTEGLNQRMCQMFSKIVEITSWDPATGDADVVIADVWTLTTDQNDLYYVVSQNIDLLEQNESLSLLLVYMTARFLLEGAGEIEEAETRFTPLINREFSEMYRSTGVVPGTGRTVTLQR